MRIVALVALMFTSATPYAMSRSETNCLAYAVYNEARGETVKGWEWVMDVIYNRSRSDKYPKNICSVIKQKAQFSFWKGRYQRIKNPALYYKILKVVQGRRWKGDSRGAMWYHAKCVKPKWRKNLVRVASVGHHIFYRARRA